jgi:hypothetical protein
MAMHNCDQCIQYEFPINCDEDVFLYHLAFNIDNGTGKYIWVENGNGSKIYVGIDVSDDGSGTINFPLHAMILQNWVIENKLFYFYFTEALNVYPTLTDKIPFTHLDQNQTYSCGWIKFINVVNY